METLAVFLSYFWIPCAAFVFYIMVIYPIVEDIKLNRELEQASREILDTLDDFFPERGWVEQVPEEPKLLKPGLQIIVRD